MNLSGKVAIVTGGGTGVGRATTALLSAAGCHTVITYSKSQAEAEATAAALTTDNVRVLAKQADVTDDAACRRMVAETVAELGGVHILIQCAGTTDFIPFDQIDQVTDDVWQRLFQVNVVGAFHCARAVREPMVASGGGIIVNVSSVAAQIAQGSSIPYCASKAALDNLTISLARTFAPHIRVNGVAPGFITGRWLENGLGETYERVKQAFERSLPLGRVCDPGDVAAAILSLVTGSRLITGQTLVVDSGMLIAGFQAKFK